MKFLRKAKKKLLPLPNFPQNGPAIAYLISEYPALSHTFITREIRALQRQGYRVLPISVRRAKNIDVQNEAHREFQEEKQSTNYLLAQTPFLLLPSFIRLAFGNPKAILRMIQKTWQLVKTQKRTVRPLAYLAEAIVLLSMMRKANIKHVHNHFGNAAGNVAMIAAASEEIEFSLSIHGPDVFYNVEADAIVDKVESAVFTRRISHYCRSQLYLLTDPKRWGKLHIVRCGVNTQLFHPHHRRLVQRANSSTTLPKVICVGRLVPAKGQHILIQAVHHLHERGYHVGLTLIGTGPDEPRLQEKVLDLGLERYIHFTGGLPTEQVREHMRSADLFVLPSFAEGIPVVLMEAMACAVPVISTPIAGIPELIEDRTNGILVAPGSVQDLSSAIRNFLEAPADWRTMALQGRETIKSVYNISESGEAMASLFSAHVA